MGTADWALMVALSVLWGGSYVFYRTLEHSFSPPMLVAGRLGIAAVGLHLLLASRGEWLRIGHGRWTAFLLLGFLNNAVPFMLVAWGELRLTSGLAAILGATTPIFGMIVTIMIGSNEGFPRARIFAVVLALAGVTIVAGPTHLARGWADALAICACLVSSLSYAVGGFYGRKFSGLPLLQVATGQVTAAAILLIPAMLATGYSLPLAMPSLAAWLGLGVMGLGCTALAYVIYFQLLPKIGPNNVMMVTMMVPVSSLLLGHWLLQEAISAANVAGTLLIGVALVLVDGRVFRRQSPLAK